MGYSKDVHDAVQAELDRRRLSAQQEASALRTRMRRLPRVCELETVMANSARRLSTAILRGGNFETEFETIKAENLAAQQEIAALLRQAGETVENFEPQYTCKACNDTGYANGKSCACRKALLREVAAQRLCRLTGMKRRSFDELDLSFYSDVPDERLGCSPREHMKSVIDYCRWYADGFDTARPNLLLRGATGTGKTHVSLAIAAAACEREANVIYGTVQSLLHRLEAEHFGRENGQTEAALLDCDLLVLDDLGTEFSSPFYTSALYALINGRLLSGRPTVINTNLDAAAIYEHYGEQIASRLIGMYEPIVFVGSDIRQQKLHRRLG